MTTFRLPSPSPVPLSSVALLAVLLAVLLAATPVAAEGAASDDAKAPPCRSEGNWSGGALESPPALPAEGEHHYILYPAPCYRQEPMVEAYPDPERASNFYAHPSVVTAIEDVAAAIHARYPDAPRVPVGELSNRSGGKIPFHRSHQNGLDVDIYFLLRSHAPPEKGALGQDPHRIVPICRDGPNMEPRDPRTGKWRVHRDFALDWNWALVSLLAKRDDVKVIFVGKLLRRALLRWAKRHHVPRAEYRVTRRKLYTPFCRGGSGIGKVSYGGNFCAHDDHIHVRFHCPEDSPKCTERRP